MSSPPGHTRGNTLTFFASSACAFVGGHVVNYSVILYSQDVLGSTALAGFAFFLCFFPPLFLGLFAGVLCDRHSTKALIGFAQAVFMLAALVLWSLPVFEIAGQWAQGLVLGAGLLSGIAWSFIAPARLATLGRLVPAAELAHVSVLFNLVIMVGFGLAPIVIGLTTAHAGWSLTFAVAFALFCVAQLSLPLVRLWWQVPSRARTVLGELKAGLDYLRAHALIRQLLIMGLAVYLTMGPVQVIWPRLATTELGLDETQRGWFLGSLALALIIGGILAGLLRTRVANGHLVILGGFTVGLGLIAMPYVHSPLLALGLLMFAGTVAGMTVSLIVAALQTQTHHETRGRVISFYTISSQVGPATAGLSSGLLADAFGLKLGFWFMGGVIACMALIASLRFLALRAYQGELAAPES